MAKTQIDCNPRAIRVQAAACRSQSSEERVATRESRCLLHGNMNRGVLIAQVKLTHVQMQPSNGLRAGEPHGMRASLGIVPLHNAVSPSHHDAAPWVQFCAERAKHGGMGRRTRSVRSPARRSAPSPARRRTFQPANTLPSPVDAFPAWRTRRGPKRAHSVGQVVTKRAIPTAAVLPVDAPRAMHAPIAPVASVVHRACAGGGGGPVQSALTVRQQQPGASVFAQVPWKPSARRIEAVCGKGAGCACRSHLRTARRTGIAARAANAVARRAHARAGHAPPAPGLELSRGTPAPWSGPPLAGPARGRGMPAPTHGHDPASPLALVPPHLNHRKIDRPARAARGCVRAAWQQGVPRYEVQR